MKIFFKRLPWILCAIFGITCLFLWLVINSFKNLSIQQIHDMQANEEKFTATQSSFRDKVASLENELDKAQAAKDVFSEQLNDAENLLSCANRNLFKPDYVLEKNMQKALMDYISLSQTGELKSATVEKIWPDSRTSLYSLSVASGEDQILYEFIVYRNDKYFAKNRVFDIHQQCWLDG
jgi:hypothetical protein